MVKDEVLYSVDIRTDEADNPLMWPDVNIVIHNTLLVLNERLPGECTFEGFF